MSRGTAGNSNRPEVGTFLADLLILKSRYSVSMVQRALNRDLRLAWERRELHTKRRSRLKARCTIMYMID
jgi:hypothetical protein